MTEALLALEEAGLLEMSANEIERLEQNYMQEVARYKAIFRKVA
jgi:hypothetical protein